MLNINRYIFLCTFSLLFCQQTLAGSFIIKQVSGFSDTKVASPVGGNPGTTIGEQRANLVAHAAAIWTEIVQPSVNMRIETEFSSLFCNSTAATLGSAGPSGAGMNFTGAAYTNTLYPRALVNHLSVSVSNPVMSVNFNSQIEGKAACLGGMRWYYGYDHNPGANQIDLLEVVLHEMAHGLGFITFVTLSTGEKSNGRNDIYMKFLRDNDLNKNWPAMSNAERAVSAKNKGGLVWSGDNVLHLVSTLNSGIADGYPRLYAPNTLSEGSSVTHWDTNLTYIGDKNELMGYQPGTAFNMALTIALMRDLGWAGAIYDFDDDGAHDQNDAFPHTKAADSDTDGDGMVDKWLSGSGCSGSTCAEFTLDGDDDADGIPDVVDASPQNAAIKHEIELPINSAYKGSHYSLDKRHR